MTVRNLILGSMLTAAAIAVPAGAQARTIEIEVDVAPPAPRVEVAPAPRPGYVYEPGYWVYDGKQYVWNEGHFIVERDGHRYVPHVLERRGEHWIFRAGHWDDED
jgi:hypothetical protein